MVAEAGSQSEAERRFGIRQQTIAVGLKGHIGPTVARQILKARKVTIETLYERHGINPDADPSGPPCGDVPGWSSAAIVAAKEHPELREAIVSAASLPLARQWWPAEATSKFVVRMARTYLERATFFGSLKRESATMPTSKR